MCHDNCSLHFGALLRRLRGADEATQLLLPLVLIEEIVGILKHHVFRILIEPEVSTVDLLDLILVRHAKFHLLPVFH